MLKRLHPPSASLEETLYDACAELNSPGVEVHSPVMMAYALLRLGAQPAEVSRLLSWREFEQLTAAILRGSGYSVRENVFLSKPRVQIDVVAYGVSTILSIDCKHHQREQGPSALEKEAAAQLRRSSQLRRGTDDPRPIVSVILSVAEPKGKFVSGAAVVPIQSLRSFLAGLDSYIEMLELN